jgi:hypothetical protein
LRLITWAFFRRFLPLLPGLLVFSAARAQVIEYESNGLKYQTLTRKGLTVIVTHLPNQVAGFGLLQVSVSNGSQIYWTVRPTDFAYEKTELTLGAISADQVVDVLLDRGTHMDVVKLMKSYENTLYGIPNMRSTNGYEQRRQNMMSFGISTRLKAAATASAIALPQTRIPPGQSTDGAVFIPLNHELKILTGGRVTFHCDGEKFEFNPD